MKGRICGSGRCDELIGLLVAFEKKAKTMEACCELPGENIDSNDSASMSVHPAYIRHNDSTRRARRGRSKPPVHEKGHYEQSKNDDENAFTNAMHNQTPVILNEDDGADSTKNISESEKGKSGHTILAVAEVVEVVIDEEREKLLFHFECSESSVSSPDVSHFETTFAIARVANENNWDALVKSSNNMSIVLTLHDDFPFDAATENFEVVTKSSSSAFTPIGERGGTVDVADKHEEGTHDVLPNNVAPFRISQKSNELLLPDKLTLNGLSILKSRLPVNIKDEKSIFREKNTTQKVMRGIESKQMVVAFRTPIHEVIPIKQGLVTSKHVSLVQGDYVDITDGMYKNKTGRVAKVFEDLVQVEVGTGFIKPLYLSPVMLRLRDAA
jgi:hypothetical protein